MKCKSVIRTHSKTVSRIVIQAGLIVTAGQDCAITVLRVTQDGAVTITHLLQVSSTFPDIVPTSINMDKKQFSLLIRAKYPRLFDITQ